MHDSHQYCTFHLGELFLGIDVLGVQEVLRPQRMTHVPHAPEHVRGLINLRGQIVTAIDLREILEVDGPPREATEQMNIVVHTSAGTLSLLVDAIGDVLDVPGARRAPLPRTIDADASYFSSVFKLDEQLLIILEPERVVDHSVGERSRG